MARHDPGRDWKIKRAKKRQGKGTPVYTSLGQKDSKRAAVGTTVDCPVPEFHMHLDANRDGTVDADRTGLSNWEYGEGKKGAIVLCNNDDDDSRKVRDNSDNKVGGGNDRQELAPLVIRKKGSGNTVQ